MTSRELSKMRCFLDGGVRKARMREYAYDIVERDPYLRFDDQSGLGLDYDRADMKEKTMVQIRRFAEIMRSIKDPELQDAFLKVCADLSDSMSMRYGVHTLLFRAAVSFFGTDSQRDALLPDILSFRVLGSFAMTELGHSSSLRDIETTATLDMQTDSWIINSPTLTSTKWWMGMVGQTATHTALLAQTIVNDTPIGLNWFLLTLREGGRLRPGITCGDLGSKAGRMGLDNGFIQITHLRIPRTDMLSRFCKVEKDGSYDGPVHPAVMYATLIPERLAIGFAGPRQSVGRALTVAVKSATKRILSAALDDALTAVTASLYVVLLAEPQVMAHWDRMLELSTSDPDTYADLLPDLHATSAGCKAVCTWWGWEAITTCLACVDRTELPGRYIASLLADWGVMTTGGGDNFPMMQQCARYVIQSLSSSLQGREGIGSCSYLSDAVKKPYTAVLDPQRWESVELYLHIISSFVVVEGQRLINKIAADKKAGIKDAWEFNATDLATLAKFHTNHHLLTASMTQINSADEHLKASLTDCIVAAAAEIVVKGSADLLAAGVSKVEHIKKADEARRKVLKRVRMSMQNLIDDLGFREFIFPPPPTDVTRRTSPDELIQLKDFTYSKL